MSKYHLIKPAHKAKQEDKVTLGVKIAWGVGGVADNLIMNVFNTLVLPVYNLAFHMSPVLLGIALFVPRYIDAITDPLMGNISDNTRSRWGRRRPYIFLGAIVCAIILPLLWMPPVQTSIALFIYFTIMSVLYSLGYTAFVVPYTALGYELIDDYDERTRTLAWRMYFTIIAGFSMPWLYKLCLMPVFEGDEVMGACWLSVAMGILIVITGVLPAVKCGENVQASKQEKIGILDAMKCTLKNRAFLILAVGCIIVTFSIFTCSTMALYVNIFYVGKTGKDIVSSEFIDKAAIAVEDAVKTIGSLSSKQTGDFATENSKNISFAQLIAAQIMFEGKAERQAFLDQREKDASVDDAVVLIDRRVAKAESFLDKAESAKTVLTAYLSQTAMAQCNSAEVVELSKDIVEVFDSFDTDALTVEFEQTAQLSHKTEAEQLAASFELVNEEISKLKTTSAVLLSNQVNILDFSKVIEKAYQVKYSIVRMEHWFVDNEKLAKKLTNKYAFKKFIDAGIAATDKIIRQITTMAQNKLAVSKLGLPDKTLNGLQSEADEYVASLAELKSVASDCYKRYDPKNFAATVTGTAGTIFLLTSYLSVFLITAISVRWGKRHGLIFGLALGYIGSVAQIFTLTPNYPYLQLISAFIYGIGLQGCWLMISSMVADVCDVDEVETGLRREGMYGAVMGFASKISISVTALAGGVVLLMSGFDAKTAGFFGNISPNVLFKMKYYYIGIQSTGILLAIFSFMFYPISRTRAEEVRKLLNARKVSC